MLGHPDTSNMAEDQSFKCPKCDKVFSKHEGYHRKKHLSEKHQLMLMWKCPQCDYKTSSHRFHDHVKHWEVRHFGKQELPEAVVFRRQREAARG